MHNRLRKKGWSEKEIQRLHRIKEYAVKHRPPLHKFLDTYLFWFIIVGEIAANFVIGVILIPVLLLLQGLGLFLVLVVLGLSLGFLFVHLLTDFQELSHHHYILIVGIVPGIAAISVMVFSEFANFLINFFQISNVQHQSVVIGLVYGLNFITPFAIKHSLGR